MIFNAGAGKKTFRFVKQIVTVFLLYSFLSSTSGFAAGINNAYLSPQISVSSHGFNDIFDVCFSNQLNVINQPDNIRGRKGFENNLFDLRFKVLFPQVVQYKLLETVSNEIVPDFEEMQVVGIKVEYSSEDYVYELFTAQGEDKLSGLIGNEEIKRHLLNVKLTRYREWIQLEGYNPPSKKRGAKEENIDKYKRKWLLNSIPPVSGYSKKELVGKSTGSLWILYFQNKLTHEFGKRLLSSVRPIEFKVTVSLKDGQKFVSDIVLIRNKDKFDVEVNKAAQDEFFAKRLDSPVLQDIEADLGQRIELIEDDVLRRQVHILFSQKEDLAVTADAIEKLSRLLDAGIAFWNSENSPEVAKTIRNEIEEIHRWLKKSPKIYKGRIQNKYLAYQALEKVVKKRGYLARNDYLGAAKELETAVDYLKKRVFELLRAVGKRDAQLFQYAVTAGDIFLVAEVLKNEAKRIDASIKSDFYDAAWTIVEFVDTQYLNNGGFQSKFSSFQAINNNILKIRSSIDQCQRGYEVKSALRLIDKVEADKRLMPALAVEMIRTQQWLEKKGFSVLAAKTRSIIDDLDMIEASGNGYLALMASAWYKTDELIRRIEAVASSSLNESMKKIIIKKLNGVRNSFRKAKDVAVKRNGAIVRLLGERKPQDALDASRMLRDVMNIRTESRGFSGVKSNALFEADILCSFLMKAQQGRDVSGDFVALGQVLNGLIGRIKKPVLVGECI